LNETAIATAGNIATNASSVYVEYGVLGVTVLLFVGTTIVLFWIVLKDKESQKTLSKSYERLVMNQEAHTTHFKESEANSKELISLLIQMKKDEKEISKDCYERLHAGLHRRGDDLEKHMVEIKSLLPRGGCHVSS